LINKGINERYLNNEEFIQIEERVNQLIQIMEITRRAIEQYELRQENLDRLIEQSRIN
jgi:hypothetical protein